MTDQASPRPGAKELYEALLQLIIVYEGEYGRGLEDGELEAEDDREAAWKRAEELVTAYGIAEGR